MKRRLAIRMRRLKTRIRRRVWRATVRGQITMLRAVPGAGARARLLWRLPLRGRQWLYVQECLERLAATSPSLIPQFVATGMRRAKNDTTIIGLMLHPYSAPAVAEWLESTFAEPGQDAEQSSAGLSSLRVGILIAAADRLLPPERADACRRSLLASRRLDLVVHQAAASFGAPALATSDAAAQRRRLVITERLDQESLASLLFGGCDAVMSIAISDLFGQALPESRSPWFAAEFAAEHVRTRVTRFSQQYIDLHLTTAEIATEAVAALDPRGEFISADDRPGLCVELADSLFFTALPVRAVETLLSDEHFTEVYVVLERNRPRDRYCQILSSIAGLATDARVRFISLDREGVDRLRYWQVVESIRDDSRPPDLHPSRVSDSLVIEQFDSETKSIAARLAVPERRRGHRIMLATTQNGAYDRSTVAYCEYLRETYDVHVVLYGPTGIAGLRADTQLSWRGTALNRALAERLRADLSGFAETLEPSTNDQPARRAAIATLRSATAALAGATLTPAVIRLRVQREYFARLSESSLLPELVVVTPNRRTNVGALVTTAKAHSIPSLAVEPHLQDAEYSRYVKVAADQYAVPLSYFTERGVTGFGSDPARTTAIGSPRLVVPANFDRPAAQAAQRARIVKSDPLVEPRPQRLWLCFVSQPSNWATVGHVWSVALGAAADLDGVVLLKPHPEDQRARINQYLEHAEAMGCAGRVKVMSGGIEESIDAADVVLTAYSTAGVDAALRQCPVVVVHGVDGAYPLQLTEMIQAHSVQSAKELVELLDQAQRGQIVLGMTSNELTASEPQLFAGVGPSLHTLVESILVDPPRALRETPVPSSLFLDPPHRTYAV